MAFQINGGTPTVMPPIGNESGVVHYPDSGKMVTASGVSLAVGLPWLDMLWENISNAGAKYWLNLLGADNVPSKALTSVQAYSARAAAYVTFSTTAIIHRPTWDSVTFRGSTPIYHNFRVRITDLS